MDTLLPTSPKEIAHFTYHQFEKTTHDTDNKNAVKNREQFFSCIFGQGYMRFIEDFATASTQNLQFSITRGFQNACYYGQLEVIRFLLTSPKLAKNADIDFDNDYAIKLSCLGGHLDVVKYLLTSSTLKKHANILSDARPLIYACEANHVHVAQYLLESSELKVHANINASSITSKSNAFMGACDQNAFDIIKYLASRPDLDFKKALYQLNADMKDGFMLACENHEKDTEIIDFLVFEMKFQPRERHLKYFQDNLDNEQICYAAKILSIRNLNEKLEMDLKYNQHVKTTKKI